ncbi:RNA-guided endonuclease InsQ/TnpB family protein [Bacillus rhizoplanae]|uniref:RNA-guided endonuclease InsQ/TnpB family protein n=1 Tax=Bacillus rhizoplanae TaxID=2880966 RepID=UPI003D1DFA84
MQKNQEQQSNYQTFQIWIKKGHRMYAYFQESCQSAKNMYNTTNFYIRQVYTGLTQEKELQPLQKEVLDIIDQYIEKMNDTQLLAYRKKLAKEKMKPKEKQKEIKCNLFFKPTKENPHVDYYFLDALFKAMLQKDYRSLPAQSSQSIMKTVFQNWHSFFASLQDYQQNPNKYTGKPRIPKYIRSVEKEVLYTNQDCVIKHHTFLKFPKTKCQLNIGKLGCAKGKLKQVRVIPKYHAYVVELVVDASSKIPSVEENGRYMGIDLGIDNLATIVTNTGMKPVLVKGKQIKSINQFYNKLKSDFTSILRQGKQTNEGPYTSKRLEKLHQKRYLKIKDLFHKASHEIVKRAQEERICKIVVGQNKNWKQETDMGKKQNQTFCHIPHSVLIQMIIYKAKKVGIEVIVIEESYTSKASFLDHDFIPTYGTNDKQAAFSGKRIKRGMYRSAKGIFINADVNAAANILRKAFPDAWTNGIEGLGVKQLASVLTPLTLILH